MFMCPMTVQESANAQDTESKIEPLISGRKNNTIAQKILDTVSRVPIHLEK